MTEPRRNTVIEDEVGIYHCISRCVRRAFLCGKDQSSGKDFSHRKEWIRFRLQQLVKVFGIEVIAYAVMSNHFHALLKTRPDIAKTWSSREVAERWLTLFPRRGRRKKGAISSHDAHVDAVAKNSKLVKQYRKRLSSLSWFNRCLKEEIARRANAEDDCTGHFWQGRFKAISVTDTSAVLATAAYIDLNPIRAGTARTIEDSDHTSIQDRLRELSGICLQKNPTWGRIPLISIEEITAGSVSLNEYLKLVDETGRRFVDGKGHIAPDVIPVLVRLKIEHQTWLTTARKLTKLFPRHVGSEDQLRKAAARVNKRWLHGVRVASRVFIT